MAIQFRVECVNACIRIVVVNCKRSPFIFITQKSIAKTMIIMLLNIEVRHGYCIISPPHPPKGRILDIYLSLLRTVH